MQYKKHILIVDDEEMILRLQEQFLNRLGYQVTCHSNSIKALKQIELNPNSFDLLIIDLFMPNLSGYELSESILKIQPNIPIIISTGFDRFLVEEKLKNLNVTDILSKPLTLNMLENKLRQVFDNQFNYC